MDPGNDTLEAANGRHMPREDTEGQQKGDKHLDGVVASKGQAGVGLRGVCGVAPETRGAGSLP